MFENGTYYYVDAPKGDEYGFPKVYNKEKDGDFDEWMFSQGYPRWLYHGYRDFVRVWKCEE